MGLQDKYSKLIDYVKNLGENAEISEKDNVLYITVSASSAVKDKAWAIYGELDPDMRSGDVVMKIETAAGGTVTIYEVKQDENLSTIAAKFPGMTWNKIYEANKDVIKNPNFVTPGQKLKIPL